MMNIVSIEGTKHQHGSTVEHVSMLMLAYSSDYSFTMPNLVWLYCGLNVG